MGHEAESDFEVGDWLQIDERRIGKVKSISWRTVTLETGDKTIIIIPQRKLSDGYINLSAPNPSLMQTVEVTLDHTIPVDRGERLLTGIVSMVKVRGGPRYLDSLAARLSYSFLMLSC